MADHLRLAIWLRGYSPLLVTSTFRKVLGEFPFSKMRPGGVLQVQAIDGNEPPVLELLTGDLGGVDDIVPQAEELYHPDTALRLEAYWEMWQWDGDWELRPSPVAIEVYGPDFERDLDEHLSIDFGPESLFLPVAESPGSHKPMESNLRSVLHLIHDLESLLAVERRLVWSESGEDFAGRLESLLSEEP